MSTQLTFALFFAFISVISAQYLVDPYVVPAVYASPYYGYLYGSNRGGEIPKTSPDNADEKPPMGFIPNPLDPSPSNRPFPPMSRGPPQFPSPILPENFQSTTMSPEVKRKV